MDRPSSSGTTTAPADPGCRRCRLPAIRALSANTLIARGASPVRRELSATLTRDPRKPRAHGDVRLGGCFRRRLHSHRTEAGRLVGSAPDRGSRSRSWAAGDTRENVGWRRLLRHRWCGRAHALWSMIAFWPTCSIPKKTPGNRPGKGALVRHVFQSPGPPAKQWMVLLFFSLHRQFRKTRDWEKGEDPCKPFPLVSPTLLWRSRPRRGQPPTGRCEPTMAPARQWALRSPHRCPARHAQVPHSNPAQVLDTSRSTTLAGIQAVCRSSPRPDRRNRVMGPADWFFPVTIRHARDRPRPRRRSRASPTSYAAAACVIIPTARFVSGRTQHHGLTFPNIFMAVR